MDWRKIRSVFKPRRPEKTEHSPYAFIDLRQVVKSYDPGAARQLDGPRPSGDHPLPALRGIDLQIQAGEFVAIAGKSGSGKSTLLNMITGIDRPTKGEIYVDGVPIHRLSEARLTIWRGKKVGIVFQFFQLIPTMTLVENVLLPMDFNGRFSARERRKRARHLLEEVDILEQAGRLPANVSGGQQQRAAIARSLANDPPLIVADEPTGNLDSATAEAVFSLLERLVDQGKTVVIVTHDLDLASRCHRIIRLADGQIVEDRLTGKKAGEAGGEPAGSMEEPASSGQELSLPVSIPQA